MMKKVLVVADLGVKTQLALARALPVAAAGKGRIDLVGFCYEPLKPLVDMLSEKDEGKIKKLLLKKREEQLKAYVAKIYPDADNIKVKTHWDKQLHDGITTLCEKSKYDLVVKSGNRSERMFYTPSDWHILRHCPPPVMIVSSKKWRKTKPIVAALDLSAKRNAKKELNERILKSAIKLAASLDKELRIVNAIEVSPVLHELDMIDVSVHEAETRKKLRKIVRKLSENYGVPEEHFILKSGRAHNVINDIAAKLRADIVVIGTVGRKGVQAKVVGNTCEQTLHHLHTDIMAVKLPQR
jgi:universal stress protein E